MGKFKRKREWFPSLKERKTQEKLREIVPEKERWTKKSAPKKVVILEFGDEKVREVMGKNTQLVNRYLVGDVNKKFLYQNNLVKVYSYLSRCLIEELPKEKRSKPFLFVAPRRGGELSEILFKKESTGKISIDPYKIQLARVKEKVLGVKEIFFESQPPDLKKLKKDVIIFDDCIASTVSIEALLSLVEEWCISQGVQINELKIWIAAAAATQRGIERLLYLAKEKYRFRDIKIIIGILVWAMNSDFYLINADNAHKYIVGDMGDWTMRLPLSFNKKVWWNRYRK